MATNTLVPHYEDNDMDRKDLADFAKQSMDKAMEPITLLPCVRWKS